MKKQRQRTPNASASPRRHQFAHVVPTVIHDPEEKMTALGRWTHRIWRNPRRPLGLLAAVAVTVLTVVAGWNVLVGRGSPTSEVWVKLDDAKKADDRITVARENPTSPASSWALLQAATELYNLGLADMPNNRDVALPMFKRALDLFDEVARESPKDAPQARAAAMGKARTLEARNELSNAVDQYELVAQNWPGTAEAKQAKELALELQRPDAKQFYKELYAYAPTRVTLPGFGSETLGSPSTSGPSSSARSGAAAQPGLQAEAPLEPAPLLPEVRTKTPPKAELPRDVFAPR